jgi:hypothetical protein
LLSWQPNNSQSLEKAWRGGLKLLDDGEEWQEEDQQSLVDVLLLVSYTEGRRPALQGDKKIKILRYWC